MRHNKTRPRRVRRPRIRCTPPPFFGTTKGSRKNRKTQLRGKIRQAL